MVVGGDTIQPDLHLKVKQYDWLVCLATQRIEKSCCLTTKKSFLLEHVCETINNNDCFPGKQKKSEYRERKSDDEVWLE